MIRQPKSTAWLPEFSQFDGAEKRKILSLCEAAAPNPYSNVTLYKSKVIESLMVSAQPPNIRFAALSYLLSKLSGQWPVLELVRCHAQLWKGLPEEAKAGHRSYQPLVDSVETKLKHSYSSILDLLHQGSLPALKDAGGRAVSHRNLYKYIEDFHLPISTAVEAGTVVAIGLSNGPTLALAVLAVSTYYTALPVNASSGAEQFRADVLQGGAKVVLVAQADVDRLKLRDKWVRDEHIQVVLVESKPDLTLRMRLSEGAEVVPRTNSANGPDDTAILLFTSGTSGTKKLVPLTVHSIVASAAFIIESWDISSSDICLNQMPLNHM